VADGLRACRDVRIAVAGLTQYAYNVALAFDRFANAALGGDPDWTLSQRMGEAIREDRCVGCYWLCRALALIDRRHCRRAYDPLMQADQRLWPAWVAFGVGVTLAIALALSLAACAGPWSLWTQTGPPEIEREDPSESDRDRR